MFKRWTRTTGLLKQETRPELPMCFLMAQCAEGDEILGGIIAQSASRLNVMDLKTPCSPAPLATPAKVMRMERPMSELRIAFAGDRDIGAWILEFILSNGVHPMALLVPEKSKASHTDDLRRLCNDLAEECIIVGKCFREPAGIEILRSLKLDYILGVHFPYLVPESVLAVSGRGFLNLHPAYLPFNRGWHTPTWAILEGTPVGATLHFMDAGLDTGDIIHQKELQISASDTADTLYRRIKKLELEVFQEAWPELVSSRVSRAPQNGSAGSFHKRGDLFQEQIQKINLDETTTGRQFLTKLIALTTDRIEEAAYFEIYGSRYRIQVTISSEEAQMTMSRAVPVESVSASVTAVDVPVKFP